MVSIIGKMQPEHVKNTIFIRNKNADFDLKLMAVNLSKEFKNTQFSETILNNP